MKLRTAVALAFATFGLAVSATSPAFAHAALTGTSPGADSTVSTVTEVSVTANEQLLDIGKNAKGFVITVRDSQGWYYGDGCVTVDGDSATMPLNLGDAGEYRVAYRIISEDGHPVEGKFRFDYDGSNSEQGVAYLDQPKCGDAQEPIAIDDTADGEDNEGAGVAEEEESTDEPTVIATPMPISAPAENSGFDIVPWIGLATIPVLVGAIWILVRTLGKRDSEDHLN